MTKFKRKSSPKKVEDDFFSAMVAEAQKVTKGENLIIPASANEPLLEVQGFIPLHQNFKTLIGCEGIPCGLITEIFGMHDSGKTTFANEVLKNTVEAGGLAFLFVVERKYSLKRAAFQGLDIRKVIVRMPKTVEQVGAFIYDVVQIVQNARKKNKKYADKPVCIVWDSLGATPCAKELDERVGDFAAYHPAAITALLRRTQGLIADHNIAFVMLNQVGGKIGVMFGKKTHSKGGYAPKFASTLRIEFTQIGKQRAKEDKATDRPSAIKAKIEVVKNHVGGTFKVLETVIDSKGFVFDRDVLKTPEDLKKELIREDEVEDEAAEETAE